MHGKMFFYTCRIVLICGLAGVMQALEKIGYSDWVIVEYGNQVEDFYQSARNMRQVLTKVGY